MNYSNQEYLNNFTLPEDAVRSVNDKKMVYGSWRWRFASLYLSGGLDSESRFRGNEPWNSKINIKNRPPEFCWKRYKGEAIDKSDFWTNVMALKGEDTGFEIRAMDKLHGCEDMIILVEVNDSGIHWGEPGDINIHDLPDNFLEGIDGDGIMVMFYDGTVWFIKKEVPLDLLKPFFTATGAREHDRNDELIKYATPMLDMDKSK